MTTRNQRLYRMATFSMWAFAMCTLVGLIGVVLIDDHLVALLFFLLGWFGGLNFILCGARRLAADGDLTIKGRADVDETTERWESKKEQR
jgi:hypothetical protein